MAVEKRERWFKNENGPVIVLLKRCRHFAVSVEDLPKQNNATRMFDFQAFAVKEYVNMI